MTKYRFFMDRYQEGYDYAPIYQYLGLTDSHVIGIDEQGYTKSFNHMYVKFLRDDEVVAKKLKK